MTFHDLKVEDSGNRNADWIKTPENIASELAIHAELEKEYFEKVEKRKRATKKDKLDGTT